MKMDIQEFIDKYCVDIKQHSQLSNNLLAGVDFTYDGVIRDEEDNHKIYVIYVEGVSIDIMDILGSTRDDFARRYPREVDLEAYDKYLSAFVIISGPELLEQVRRQVAATEAHIKKFANLPVEELL